MRHKYGGEIRPDYNQGFFRNIPWRKIGSSRNRNHKICTHFLPYQDTPRHSILRPFLKKPSDICLNWIFRIVKEIILAGWYLRIHSTYESRLYLYGHLAVGRWFWRPPDRRTSGSERGLACTSHNPGCLRIFFTISCCSITMPIFHSYSVDLPPKVKYSIEVKPNPPPLFFVNTYVAWQIKCH